MLPLPPTSTLFPYTTLFRSHKLSQLFRGELDWIVMKALEKDRNRRYETANGFAADVQRYLHDEPVQDRKSTRLNSSHLGISYAVFCLKKKKKNKTMHMNYKE